MFFKKTGNMTQVPGAVMHLIEPTTLPNNYKALWNLRAGLITCFAQGMSFIHTAHWRVSKAENMYTEKAERLELWVFLPCPEDPGQALKMTAYGEQYWICDLRRRFIFGTRDQAWSLKSFCVAEFY